MSLRTRTPIKEGGPISYMQCDGDLKCGASQGDGISSTGDAPRAWFYAAPDATNALGARRDFMAFLQTVAATGSDVGGAIIIYGELVGNVVRHAPGPIDIRLDWTPERNARLSVRDSGRPFDLTQAMPGVLSEGGRGLRIVASLALDLRVERETGGSVVTAVLPVTAR